ncbi:cytochrome b/b6 domain-containing protein [Variovorax sp. J22P168]|uniref:cytochrome b/b6 domain-containing protein n=1 Tax=Variovorax jilinensis TaxID=3053513 RepID=UPI00257804C0|nr:cytochrome b/b6 domain-containing protein [Variovorax sp. J22P168]MDM0010822.1 cytochrome b/b6 domain-containing protein [Variovorax sp. J22P168]
MPAPSEPPTRRSAPEKAVARRTRVWDLPTRIFHWTLATAVIAQVATGLAGVMEWHFRIGYLLLALLLFRLVWGFVGGHWSRFRSFAYGPGSLTGYLRGRAHPDHLVGHTPLGALSVFALLGLLVLQVATGLVADDEISTTGPLSRFVSSAVSGAATQWHAVPGKWLLIALIALHVLAVLFHVLVKRHRLVRPMLDGDKLLEDRTDAAASRDDAALRLLALAVFAACAAFATWIATLRS